jgi:hypothetical protein
MVSQEDVCICGHSRSDHCEDGGLSGPASCLHWVPGRHEHCQCSWYQFSKEETKKARLLEAAPELLVALKMLVALDPRCHRGVIHCGECAYCLAQAAITKAEEGKT